MYVFINLSTILFLIIVFIQDIKQRLISAWLIPVLAVLLVIRAIGTITLPALVEFFIINFSFFFLQLFVLTLYVSVKNKKFVNIVNTHLGIGDILFIIIMCIVFSPVNFMFFYIACLLLTLIGVVVYNVKAKQREIEIPLAGAMAGVLAACLLFNMLFKQVNFYNDQLSLTLFK